MGVDIELQEEETAFGGQEDGKTGVWPKSGRDELIDLTRIFGSEIRRLWTLVYLFSKNINEYPPFSPPVYFPARQV